MRFNVMAVPVTFPRRCARWILRSRGGTSMWIAVLLAMGGGPTGAQQPDLPFPQGIAAGDVTPISVVLWASVPKSGMASVRFEWSTDPAFSQSHQSAALIPRPDVPIKLEVTGLTPGTRYYYRATGSLGNSSTGQFRTPYLDTARHGLRFGVSGDWRGDLAPFPAVGNAATQDLAFFLALGDTIYADVPSPDLGAFPGSTEEFRIKHREVYSSRNGLNTLAELRAATALYAMIDDHELIDDFAGGAPAASDARFGGTGLVNETEGYRQAMQAFIDYNPIRDERWEAAVEPRLRGKTRLYRSRQFGLDAVLLLVDARSFRDEPLPPIANALDPEQGRVFEKRSMDLDPVTGKPVSPRTMLGSAQLERLKADLKAAQAAGVTWKFVALGEPMQAFGPVGAPDRYEGYARERNDILSYIATEPIDNVVFISADFHATLVNNLLWRALPSGPWKPSGAFEIVTGAVAYDKPFGPQALDRAATVQVLPQTTLLDAVLGFVGLSSRNEYDALPISERDGKFKLISDLQLNAIGLDPLGLEGSDIHARLESGNYVAAHTFNWSQFDIDPASQALTVTTFGIPAYDAAHLPSAASPPRPAVVGKFVVPARSGPKAPAGFQIRNNGIDVELSWPTTSNWILESTPTLSPAEWTMVVSPARDAAGRTVVTISAQGGAGFYRWRALP